MLLCAVTKPGICPKLVLPRPNPLCPRPGPGSKCRHDGECPGTEKCCRRRICGGLECGPPGERGRFADSRHEVEINGGQQRIMKLLFRLEVVFILRFYDLGFGKKEGLRYILDKGVAVYL